MKMKTPITYYGGKQNMVKHILPLISEHTQYVEPFFGGGAVFFAKPKSKHEVINDTNNMVINFYEVMKTNFDKLCKKIESTLFSEYSYRKAGEILKSPIKDKVEYAWAFWVQTNMSFTGGIFKGFAFSNNARKSIKNKRDYFHNYNERLEHLEIFNRDALSVIKLKNTTTTFIYCDPPYYNSSYGHYEGYTQEDFLNLLNALKNHKGKFLLSCYPCNLTKHFIKENNYYSKQIKSTVSVSCRLKAKQKTESLIWNYDISDNHNLF